MIMYILTAKGRHAIGDCFLDMVNQTPEKDKIYVAAPSCYKKSEFSDNFYKLIFENFFGNGKIKSKILAIKFALKIRKELKKHKINKIFVFDECEWFNILLYTFTIGCNTKWYTYIHDPTSHTGEQKRIKIVRKFVFHTIIKKAKKIFVSYNGAKDELLKQYKFIDSKKIDVYYLPRMKQMEFPIIKESINNTKTFKYDVIFYGRLEKYKGLDYLFESITLIKQKYSIDIKLLVIGSSGTEKEFVKKEINKLDKSKYIEEYLSSESLAKEIAQSKIVVLPYKDATGTQVIQIANYYNKPAITSSAGCFKEYVTTGQNGIVMEKLSSENLAENIYLLLNNENYYEKIVSNINKVLEDKFDISKFSTNIFNTIIKQ